jgi:hypothetical protein
VTSEFRRASAEDIESEGAAESAKMIYGYRPPGTMTMRVAEESRFGLI